MNFTIAGPHIKVFGKVVHCLAKFGNELFFQDTENGLKLLSVNQSKSAFASILLSKLFFHEYDTSTYTGNSESSTFHCKINMKIILGAFKSLPSIEKSVEKCSVHCDNVGSKLTIKFYCRHDIVKAYEIGGCETERLCTVYSKSGSNKITMPIRVLSDILQTFNNKQMEISVNVNADSIIIENEIEDKRNSKGNQVVHTRFKLQSGEFSHYQLENDETSITFCLKELRGVVLFSEIVDLPVEMIFTSAGNPIVFSFSVKDQIEGDFVLATLSPSLPSSPETQPAQTVIMKKQPRKVPKNIPNKSSCTISPSEPSTSKFRPAQTVTEENMEPFSEISGPSFRQEDRFKSIFDSPSHSQQYTSHFEKLASDTEGEDDDLR